MISMSLLSLRTVTKRNIYGDERLPRHYEYISGELFVLDENNNLLVQG